MSNPRTVQAALPSVDRVLRDPAVAVLIQEHGREAVVAAVRKELEGLRAILTERSDDAPVEGGLEKIAERAAARLRSAAVASLRPVFNLTGTILHTNLGRAALPEEALQAISTAASRAVNLEFDVQAGRRGDRDLHLESLLVRLTGAEKATVVNNNAAAVLLVLNTLGLKRDVLLSRGELIEIGGEFRMPEIMKRAGCRLVEVGTTNRTHLRDYEEALGPATALIMKVHASNFEIRGFTSSVEERTLAAVAHKHGIPLVSDLGSGTLVDLRRWGLPHEPTPAELIGGGVDLVTFSGDKLLGGPQAGVIVGRRDLLDRINRNPLKRALRVDKLRIAALEAVLRLYADPDRLAQRLPVLRHMTRTIADIEAQASRLAPALEQVLAGRASVRVVPCESEAGSGSLPADRLPSRALALSPLVGRREASARVQELSSELRSLPIPVIGRLKDAILYLDLRCLDDETAFVEQLDHLLNRGGPAAR